MKETTLEINKIIKKDQNDKRKVNVSKGIRNLEYASVKVSRNLTRSESAAPMRKLRPVSKISQSSNLLKPIGKTNRDKRQNTARSKCLTK